MPILAFPTPAPEPLPVPAWWDDLPASLQELVTAFLTDRGHNVTGWPGTSP